MNENHQLQAPSQLQALLIIIITIGFTFVAGAIAVIVGFKKQQILLIEVFTIIPALVFVISKQLPLAKTFRLRTVNAKIILSSIFIGISLSILTDEADRLVAMVFPMPESLLAAIEDSLAINTHGDLFFIIFSAVLLAGICEEMLFRGFLQTSFEKHYDVTRAVMLCSLVFAIVHFNPWWTIQLILFSIFLGVLAWKSNSIIPSMLAHSINNGLALIFANLEETQLHWYLWKDHVKLPVIGLAMIVLYFGIKQFYRYCDEFNKHSSNPDWNHPVR